MFEQCMEIRARFSEYLDGACDHEGIRSIRYHLCNCPGCRREIETYEYAQSAVRALSPRRVPAEVALRLRVRLSQELHRNFFSRLRVHLENALRPLLLPASGGVLTAIVCFGLILGVNVSRVDGGNDIPLDLTKPARVRELVRVGLPADGQIVVVTQIASDGRAVGYEVVRGNQTPELLDRLDYMIYFSLFDPATTFGRPTGGQVILTFRRITIRG